MPIIDFIYNHDVNKIPMIGKWDLPPIMGTEDIPANLWRFEDYKKCKNPSENTLQFYTYDFKFECVWSRTDFYIEKFKKFRSIITPDFSTYRDMPLGCQLYNVWRSRVIGYLMEQNGIRVIPTLQWSDERSFDWCFDGLPQHRVIAVSTVGVERDKWAKILFMQGIKKALEIVKPSALVLYGNDLGIDFGNVEVIKFNGYDWKNALKKGEI